ncbi:high affinity potassium transporter [Scheffersomyces amazonensis]|uniref:high affinity potassium transporter n=1 Tax=Scheffersomyces amazonensis TaxID=1078765 RepID=UPI00315C6227
MSNSEVVKADLELEILDDDVVDNTSIVSHADNYSIDLDYDDDSFDDEEESNRDLESQDSIKEHGHGTGKQNWKEIFMLSFSSLGAIYGDIGTSPLYVLNSIKYSSYPPNKDDIYGGISVIFYIFTIIVIFKYVAIVLVLGPNNGEGGQVAIYAKIARYLNIGPKGVRIPGAAEISDMELLTRQDTTSSFMSANSQVTRIEKLRKSPTMTKFIQTFILCACFIGCSLVFSDGLLTPTTSVLSAIGGIQVAVPSFDHVLAVSEVILVALFIIQQFGSNKISFLFAPIVFIWLIGLLVCGIYNIVKHDPGVFKALSPYYAIKLLKNSGVNVFGGAMLSITGTEAMFADIGHFGKLPIQITLGFFVYPSLIICYLGQGAYLVGHPEAYVNPFFLSIPGGTSGGPYWLMFVLSTLATIIASQALILSVFSIVSQLINLDCFPQLKIVHVSKAYEGKVYIPSINWLLMIGVCLTTAGFKNSNNVTAAYGLGISLDFIVTSSLMVLCMFYVFKFNIIWPIIYVLIFVPLEMCLVIANMSKVVHGAWFPLMMTGLSFLFLSIWRWGRSRKVNHEFSSRISIGDLFPRFRKTPELINLNLGPTSVAANSNSTNDAAHITKDVIHEVHQDTKDTINTRFGKTTLKRHEGIAIMYNDSSMQNMNSPNTLPLIYAKLIKNFSSIPSTFIFCSTRVLSIPYVPQEDRVLIASMKIPGHYRCILRFGFMEEITIDYSLNKKIISSIPGSNRLARKFSSIEFESNNVTVDNIPILHIFENNMIRSHDYSSEEYKTKNPFKIIHRLGRKILINYLFSPLSSMTQERGRLVKLKDEEEESDKKIFIGGISRI